MRCDPEVAAAEIPNGGIEAEKRGDCSPCSSGGSACTDKPLRDTAFRQMEKRFKEYRPDPRRKRTNGKGSTVKPETHVHPYGQPHAHADTFDDVLDMRAALRQLQASPDRDEAGGFILLGIHPQTSRAVLSVREREGLYVLPCALSLEQQGALLQRALTEYTTSSYVNNVTNLGQAPLLGGYEPSLRWATLGYVYDWTRKEYLRSTTSSSGIPPEVMDLVRSLHADLHAFVPQPRCETYTPQVAIVNYFPRHSMMMAHQDVSEASLDRALVSISLGCSAIFLMGTEDREVTPTPLLLRSGDVVIMAGPTRLGYHGVPRILDDFPSELYTNLMATHGSSLGPKVREVPDIVKQLRVNINVRQVHENTST